MYDFCATNNNDSGNKCNACQSKMYGPRTKHNIDSTQPWKLDFWTFCGDFYISRDDFDKLIDFDLIRMKCIIYVNEYRFYWWQLIYFLLVNVNEY